MPRNGLIQIQIWYKDMKIAFVSTSDPLDVHAWSGTVTHTFKALQNAGFEMSAIGNLQDTYKIRAKLKKLFYAGFSSKKYLRDREPALLQNYAKQTEQGLKENNCDVIFSPGYAPVVYMDTDKPLVFWADGSFAGLHNYYSAFSNLCNESIRNGNAIEQMALAKCRLAIYSSEWAAKSAMKNYDVDPSKVKVVPFGANINCDRTIQDIETICRKKTFSTCRLLFLGVEWQRKGGDIALEIAKRLNARGLKTQLHVVGCEPGIAVPDFVIRHGFISKRTDVGRAAIDRLFSVSHFMILPTRAECFGIALAEASSFGLPSVTTNTGGIPTAIHNGKNGQMFELDANPDEYCDYIQGLMEAPDKYQQLAMSSFKEYSQRLNWTTVGHQLGKLLREFC